MDTRQDIGTENGIFMVNFKFQALDDAFGGAAWGRGSAFVEFPEFVNFQASPPTQSPLTARSHPWAMVVAGPEMQEPEALPSGVLMLSILEVKGWEREDMGSRGSR